MSIQKILYDKPIGLVNCGNTCYINAVLQCLVNCDDFNNEIMSMESEFAVKYKDFIINWQNVKVFDPRSFLNDIFKDKCNIEGVLSGNFGSSYEFTNYMLECFHKNTILDENVSNYLRNITIVDPKLFLNDSKNIKYLCENSSIVYKYFGVITNTVYQCTTCKSKKNMIGVNFFLSCEFFPIIKRFYCDTCDDFEMANSEIANYYYSPNNIIMNMSYFIPSHITTTEQKNTRKNIVRNLCDKPLIIDKMKYYLSGLVLNISKVHYISFVRKINNGLDIWYECNDSTITETNIEKIKNTINYTTHIPDLLFFKKVNNTITHDIQEYIDIKKSINYNLLNSDITYDYNIDNELPLIYFDINNINKSLKNMNTKLNNQHNIIMNNLFS